MPAPKVCAMRRANSGTVAARVADGPERQIVADDVDRGKRVEAAAVVHEPADHAPVAEHDGAAVALAVGPGVDRGEEVAVRAVVDEGERRRKTVAVDLHDRQAVPVGFLKQWRQHLRRPGDAFGRSQGAGVVRNRRQSSDQQAVPFISAAVSAQRDRDRLAAVARKEVGLEFGVLGPGHRKRGGVQGVSPC